MYVACEEARGERVFLIDSDLEEAPEWLADFSREMASTGADVVYGVQEKRKGGLFEAVSRRVVLHAVQPAFRPADYQEHGHGCG